MGGRAGDFFGGSSSGGQGYARGGGSAGGRNPSLSAALQGHLRVLGFTVTSAGALPDAEAVRGAYRRLALQAHPDKPGGSKAAFQELQNAYEAVLSAIEA